MAPVNLPHVQIYAVRGKLFAYFRRHGRRVRIKAVPGAEAFPAAYEVARAEWEGQSRGTAPEPRQQTAPGTLAALIEEFKRSPEFREMATKTRRDYAAVLDGLAKRFGTVAASSPNRAWVFRMRDEAQATPRTANYRVAIIRRLFSFGMDRGLVAGNPALRIGTLETGEGHRVWTLAEANAMTSAAAGDIALPVLLGLYTAQRKGDVLRLPWSAYDGAALRLRQSKTGTELTLPVPMPLKAALDATPRRAVVICVTATGRPWTADHFAHRFAQTRAALGLAEDLHFHGLRHTRLTALAEAGATEAELMGTGGHKATASVHRYTRKANQAGLARAAAEKLEKQEANAELSNRLPKVV